MNRKRMLSAASVVLAGLAASASAEVITIPASKDAMIFGTAAGADTNNASGRGPAMFAGADGSSNRKRSLIAFDVAGAGIPAAATITGVTMTLYLSQVAGSGGGSGGGGSYPTRILSLYDNLQDWGEGNSGAPTSPSVGGAGQGYTRVAEDSSWDYAFYDPTNLTAGRWTDGTNILHGGNTAATATATSTFTVFTTLNSPYAWSGAGMVADVQGWLAGGANYGWMIRSDNLEGSPTSFLGFWTRDGAAANGNPGIAPSLTITYSVPEPGAAAELLAAGAVLVRRRR